MFSENGGKIDREPVILRTITSVMLDDVLASCYFFFLSKANFCRYLNFR